MSSAENFIYQSEQIIEYYVSSLKDSFNDKYFESNEFPNDTLQENSYAMLHMFTSEVIYQTVQR